MHRRAKIVQKSRQRKRQRARRAARLGLGLKYIDAHPACASTMAAASPFGPDPITHARLIVVIVLRLVPFFVLRLATHSLANSLTH